MTLNRRLTIAIGVTALLGVAAVQAEELGRASVPFAFEASGKTLDAGPYSAVDNGGILFIRNNATGQGVYLLPVPAGLTNTGQSSMTFRCYSSKCFLKQIQFSGTRRLYQVGPSRHEVELAKSGPPQITPIAVR